MKLNSILNGWAVIAACTAGAAALAAPPDAQMLSNACAGCHGTNGSSADLAIPSLAGQPKILIVESLTKFRSGERPSTVMGRLAKGYSDAEIDLMAEFFSGQKLRTMAQLVDAAKARKGADLQEANCSRCRLDDGKDGTPVMAGQWFSHAQMQMGLYRSGARKMPGQMAEKVKPTTKDDLTPCCTSKPASSMGELT